IPSSAAVWPSPFLMAPASPMSTPPTSLRQSVFVSPSDRLRGGLSRAPTWVREARDRRCAALRGSANFENATPHLRSRCRGASVARQAAECPVNRLFFWNSCACKATEPKERAIGTADVRETREETLNKTLAGSFPASDPQSTLPNPSADSF